MLKRQLAHWANIGKKKDANNMICNCWAVWAPNGKSEIKKKCRLIIRQILDNLRTWHMKHAENVNSVLQRVVFHIGYCKQVTLFKILHIFCLSCVFYKNSNSNSDFEIHKKPRKQSKRGIQWNSNLLRIYFSCLD